MPMNSSWLTRARCLACAAAALLALPAAAEANWVIKGRAFGHGVGMSQYGAYGYAQHGRNYKQILAHYYTNTKVGKRKGGRVRVLLGAQGQVEFSGASEACGKNLKSDRDYSFADGDGRVSLLGPNGTKLRSCGEEGRAKGARGVDISGFGRYRGDLIAHAHGKGVLVINSLSLEGYVKGVVPNEMPWSWDQQALKAQAVAARSYAVATSKSGVFDQYADTRSQVYGGRDTETRRTSRAVKKTRRRVVLYKGDVATTYYFSTSGGETENVEFGFSGADPSPYLKSVNDPYDEISPLHKWKVTYSDGAMESRLSAYFDGNLKEIDVLKTGRSPRIVRARVVGTSGSTEVSGSTLQSRLGLRSTWATFDKQ
jgi:SpoIID/LytB domain protein